jgi:hypothetical protein
MRKQIIAQASPRESAPDEESWLALEELAQVELTSEQEDFPIESALTAGAGPGWRAALPGPQVIRLRFSEPVRLRSIRLLFEEQANARTQEFVLGWLPAEAGSFREIVRQQYTFSPPGTTRELEEYQVDLVGVMGLELRIVPDIGAGAAPASLLQFRVR